MTQTEGQTTTEAGVAEPSDADIQRIADRLLLNFGRVGGCSLADAVAAHHGPMDEETYWRIRPRVFSIAEATGAKTP
jgi:hypothetical protein